MKSLSNTKTSIDRIKTHELNNDDKNNVLTTENLPNLLPGMCEKDLIGLTDVIIKSNKYKNLN